MKLGDVRLNQKALGYTDSKGKWVAKSKPTIVKVKVTIK